MDVPIVLAALGKGPAILAAVAVVVAVILLWKLVKFAFRLALIGAAAVVIFFLLKQSNLLG